MRALKHNNLASWCAVVSGAFALAGCSLPLQPGVSGEADVVAYFGKPEETRKLADGGTEYDYPRGPLGRETWRVHLNNAGKVAQVEQLLEPNHFNQIQRGMTREQVHRVLGRQAITSRYKNLNEEVWSWRYIEMNDMYFFFNAHFDAATGQLKYASRTIEIERYRRRR